jgi:hypothetical protein
MATRITHRRLTEQVTFDDDAVTVRTWHAGTLRVPWGAFDFVCLTPSHERTAQGWRAKPSIFPGSEATLASLERHGVLDLGFVVRDRRPHLAALHGRWRRLFWGSRLRPMVDGDERSLVDQSLLQLPLDVRLLDVNKDALLDLLEARCRFDLVAYGWPG